jgi:trk system potassium uptake protein
MGIVVLFVAVFPNVGAGGKHMFRSEVPGATSEGLVPRIAETAFALWRIYLVFTDPRGSPARRRGHEHLRRGVPRPHHHAVGWVLHPRRVHRGVRQRGHRPDHQRVHDPTSLNFGLYFTAMRTGSMRPFFRSLELKVFMGIVTIATVTITLLILPLHGNNPFQAFRYALFQVGTFASSTGYTTDAYMSYPGPALTIILFLMFVGGMLRLHGGRHQGRADRAHVQAGVGGDPPGASGRPWCGSFAWGAAWWTRAVLADVAAFFGVYMGSLAALVIVGAAVEGVPLPQAFGMALTSLSNMGPTPFYGDADNFVGYSVATKTIFALAMLLGRLEFFTLLALLVPEFWKR